MNAPAVQEDFGAFNPRFFGVTLKIASPEAFRVLHEFIVSDELPLRETDFTRVAIRSALDHEARHYCDFLISSHGALLFRSRLSAALSGFAALDEIRDLDGSFVPFPVTAWAKMTPEGRAGRAHEWRQFLNLDESSFRLAEIPYVSPDDLAKLKFGPVRWSELSNDMRLRMSLTNIVKSYGAVEKLVSGAVEPTLFSPSNIYEVSAVAAQLQAVWHAQGEAATDLFLRELGESMSWRAQLWRYFWQLESELDARIRAGGQVCGVSTVDRIATMCCWCLLGNYEAEGRSASPSWRLLWLRDHLRNAGSAADSGLNVAATWDGWDRKAGVMPWRQSLATLVESNRAAAERYYADSDDRSIAGTISRVFRRYLEAQDRLVKRIRESPEDYVHMERYTRLDPGVLPVPLIRLQLKGFSVSEELLKTCYAPIYFSPDIAVRNGSSDFQGQLDDAAFLESYMQRIDLAFSEHDIPEDLRLHGKQVLENYLRKRVLFIV